MRCTHIAVHALVSPEVVTRGEETEANEVRAAMALPSQLTGTFVEDIHLRGACNGIDTCTGTDGIELLNTATAYATYNFTLSHHQVDITQTEYGEVSIGEGVGIGQDAAFVKA